jgi:hypothetical protein
LPASTHHPASLTSPSPHVPSQAGPILDALAQELAILAAWARPLNVTLRLSTPSPRRIDLGLIEGWDGPLEGSGATVLRRLCDLADRRRLRVHLCVFSADPTAGKNG